MSDLPPQVKDDATIRASVGDRVKILGMSYYHGNRWINLINSHIGEEAVVREMRPGGASVNLISNGHGYFILDGDYQVVENPGLTLPPVSSVDNGLHTDLIRDERPKIDDQQLTGILGFMKRRDEIEAMSDEQLSDAVLNKVWGTLRLGSEQDMLLDEMLTRFDLFTGIERGEDGEILPERELTAADHEAIEKGWQKLKGMLDERDAIREADKALTAAYDHIETIGNGGLDTDHVMVAIRVALAKVRSQLK